MNFNNFTAIVKPKIVEKDKVSVEVNKITKTQLILNQHLLKKVFQYCEHCQKPTVQNIVSDDNIVCIVCNKK